MNNLSTSGDILEVMLMEVREIVATFGGDMPERIRASDCWPSMAVMVEVGGRGWGATFLGRRIALKEWRDAASVTELLKGVCWDLAAKAATLTAPATVATQLCPVTGAPICSECQGFTGEGEGPLCHACVEDRAPLTGQERDLTCLCGFAFAVGDTCLCGFALVPKSSP